VPHQTLLEKLRSHGIRGELLNWITAWLGNRKQRVCVRGCASGWRTVTSGVPQGSVLGPILFLIFINDLDFGMLNSILKFADDTKVYGEVVNQKSREDLQNDLDLLVKWSDEWQMKFNVQKCKVMHIGKNNMEYKYTMNGMELESTKTEKDLGVVMSSDLKSTDHCLLAYNKASRMLGMMGRTMKSRNPEILLSIYKSIVRPHLEYCTPAWSPHYKKDKDLLERVQHRFTRMFSHLRHLEYEERLNILGLWSLEERRNRADLLEVYKMASGKSGNSLHDLFTVDKNGKTRGHSLKLIKKFSKGNTRHHFFTERVVSR